MIWGVNTLFLLDAGLGIGEAFAANAFATAGMVLFEVPTGLVADTVGRRASYLLGAATLLGSTLLYPLLWWAGAPFAAWAVASVLLGLGYTFFRVMLAGPFGLGVSVYGSYAAQPYLLQLAGRGDSYAIAGLAAALVAGAQIAGGALSAVVGRAFRRRTSVLLAAAVVASSALALLGVVSSLGTALVLLAVWAVVYAAASRSGRRSSTA